MTFRRFLRDSSTHPGEGRVVSVVRPLWSVSQSSSITEMAKDNKFYLKLTLEV